MLKGVPAVISPELLKILAEMGHGDELVIADAHFPSHTFGKRVTHADALSSTDMLKAVLKLIEPDQYVKNPVVMMEPVPGDSADPGLLADCRAALGKDADRIEFIERFAFYERAKGAFAVVVSGETRVYGNIILKKGVTPVCD